MDRIKPFSTQNLEAACHVLGDTERGLTGSQIGRILQEIRVEDVSPDHTKWKRLFNALAGAQNKHQVGNHLVMFITRAMNPVSYLRDKDSFDWRRGELNVVLAFSGLQVREDGKVIRSTKAAPLRSTGTKRLLRVFLCHSSADKNRVRMLYQELKSADVAPWLDEEDILPGQDWNLEIGKAIRKSDVVLVCLSQSSVTKAGYVQKEISAALDVADQQPEGTIFLIPVKLENCDVPERLSQWQWVDLYASEGHHRLSRALKAKGKSLGLSAQ